MGMFRYYDIGHAEVFIFDDFLIKQVKEGALIDQEETEEFKVILKEHFSDKNMAYISNRVTSYSVNPLVYKEAEKISNLVAIAIIPGDEKMRASAEYESQFYNRPFGIFESLSEAIQWVHKIIEKENETTYAEPV
ncbi:hypothetical protein [uncultured Psychroserpens sp.]|uniref:hypothetical protein n=1 Tax=uncultured Psychroserpens sp. TaxID=255436 RepID=UPI002619A802|nr:hypothetical protein [uncultured Psychroserpens sp.]